MLFYIFRFKYRENVNILMARASPKGFKKKEKDGD